MAELTGKLAVVTGAGRGIGRATALLLAEHGADLALCSRTPEQVEQVAHEARSRGCRARAWPVDVSSRQAVEEFARQVERELGPADVLVNNAAIYWEGATLEMPPDEWDRLIQVNLTGPFLCARAFAPAMIARGSGVIINISSMSGVKPYFHQGAYCASKYGLVGLSKVLAWELKDQGVRVAVLCPGGVDTELVGKRPPEQRAAYMAPERIAEAVLHLATLDPSVAVDQLVMRRWAADPW